MIKCPSCSCEILDDSRLCSYCGAPVAARAGIPTETAPPKAVAPAAHPAPSGSSSDAIDQARFTPGTMLTERYRIVGLLGKGGMGEVYRADDLKLRQSVALKFLPAALSRDSRRLERFHHEVRVARQVSHPNVCRVYDIGEAEGQPFISMEYVDGEDLASVLRRMGKPSPDKALQIARQLCAGLAAAHDRGVLHRDLKPHNVMIDGRGKVRITDFGLAGFVEDFAGREVVAGTPAYMAPEQLAGREVSVKSDVYSLGLVLFELFAGKRLFEGATREQIERLRSTTPTTLSGLAEDIDPAVERVIQRCLEIEPSARPSSALAVAAALPGGDPLAAALAAGETPDPEMVAAAGGVGGMRPAVAALCLLGVVVGLVAVALLNNSMTLYRKVSLPLPPDALAFRASEILKKLGHTTAPKDKAYGFEVDDALLRYIQENDDSPDRWDKLAGNQPPALYFWYRQSPQELIPPSSERSVSLSQPPPVVAGMASVLLDPEGRLIELTVVPPQRKEKASSDRTPTTDWPALFDEAQLDLAAFEAVDPVWNPVVHCDQQGAWEGRYPTRPDVSLRVEAGSYDGNPTFFKMIGPWGGAGPRKTAKISTLQNVGEYMFVTILVLTLLGSVLFAWKNLRLHRGDRRGAFRTILGYFLAMVVVWLLRSTHVSRPLAEFWRFIIGIGEGLFFAGWVWLLYIAFEPYVRRRWPQTLISWTRLLMGRLRDPLVGRAVLIGCLFGIGLRLLLQLQYIAPAWFDQNPPAPDTSGVGALLGGSRLAARLVMPWFIANALWHLFMLFALRFLFRKQWIAAMLYVVVLATTRFLEEAGSYAGSSSTTTIAIVFLFIALFYSVHVVTLLRLGLLSLAVALLSVYHLQDIPITLDFSAWYATGSLVTMLVLLSVAVYGFHTALAGRPLLKEDLL